MSGAPGSGASRTLVFEAIEDDIPGLHARGVTAYIRVVDPRDCFADRRDFDAGQIKAEHQRAL